MGKFIFGAIIGFILSDAITSKFPKAQQFKIPPTFLQNLFPKPIELKGLEDYYRDIEEEYMILH